MKGSWIFLIYTGLVCASSLYHDQASSPLLLVLASLGYALTHIRSVHTFIPAQLAIQLSLLVALHAASLSDWCFPLYLLHMCKLFYGMAPFRYAVSANAALMLAYAFISMAGRPFSWSTLIEVVFTAGTCLLLAFMFRKYIYDIEQQKQLLTKEKKHLSTHDSLTGLYNFQEFHKQMEQLVKQKEPIILVLIDCKDLKSLNTTNGFQGVNKILRQAAELLRIMFPDALLICRYGGDEFAIVLRSDDMQETVNAVTQLLASEFPKLTGIEINFGMACYSRDGVTKDDLIVVAEHGLYMMKRESWLKREEHMLRSEKLRVVGELASGMAHEIRNPLTTIKGFLQLSKAGDYNIEPWYELIMDEINRMSMLTAEFLQFSKPHVTQYKIQSIQGCIYRVLSLLDSETTRLGHQVRFEHDDRDIQMLMDQDKMLQLLLNLVKNAFEAMPEQGIVRIRLFAAGPDAVIEISDTGKGIPESELDKIFIPFYTTKDSGTGLGLSICHKIVQDHEGTIEVESVPDEGTKFTITLPTSGTNDLIEPYESSTCTTISV
ncbi:histidine kinase [Paenibacillus elgii]|uniref:histidine kinase n=1 Tax=Paenibacillus elgii TaxID=189691 RepID=A0A2T6G3T0_9BACL|nr:ATP-binding protein [Paenibacillus elgii]PUA38814.1 histidine kinase [Paenibacillus elgii]